MSILHNRTASAASVYFDDKRIHVRLSDGREISAPLNGFHGFNVLQMNSGNSGDSSDTALAFTGKR